MLLRTNTLTNNGATNKLTAPALDKWFILAVLFAVLFKSWLTSDVRILPYYGPHDTTNYLEHAVSLASGHWFGTYDNLTLIKQPFFPIYLALVEQIGLPLPTAHLLLDALAGIVACLAVAPLIKGHARLITLFLILYFNPFSYDSLAWLTLRSQINPDLALLSISCAFGIYTSRAGRRRNAVLWSVGLGASFSAFWLTREEAVWLVPGVLMIFAAYVLWAVRQDRSKVRWMRLVILVPCVILAISVGSVMIKNGLTYGWFVTNEQQAPEFDSAYNSLARIDVSADRHFPAPKAAREIAYRVSPAAKELEKSFEGPNGTGWVSIACGADPDICVTQHDIARGWFQFAFRDAVSAAGHHSSGASARAYYVELARQLDAACAAQEIRCTPKGHTLYPLLQGRDAASIASAAVSGLQNLLLFKSLSFDPWAYDMPSASLVADYNFVARSVDDGAAPNRPHEFDHALKQGLIRQFGRGYEVLMGPCVCAMLLLVAFRIYRAIARRAAVKDHVVLASSVLVSVLMLVFVLSIITVYSFNSFNAEYMGAMMPLILLAFSVTLLHEGLISRRVLSRHISRAGNRARLE